VCGTLEKAKVSLYLPKIKGYMLKIYVVVFRKKWMYIFVTFFSLRFNGELARFFLHHRKYSGNPLCVSETSLRLKNVGVLKG